MDVQFLMTPNVECSPSWRLSQVVILPRRWRGCSMTWKSPPRRQRIIKNTSPEPWWAKILICSISHFIRPQAHSIELNVIVMTSNAWPMTHSPSSCMLPPEMAKAKQSFERFYLSRHSGRRLNWQYSLGNADVNTRFKNRVHELNVATFALIILLLFENLSEDDFLTYSVSVITSYDRKLSLKNTDDQEIKDATQIEENELKRHLQSLACGKFKVLKKHPSGRDINFDDSFSFNNDFSSPMKKIKIATVSSKVETSEESKATMEGIEEERKHQIEVISKNFPHTTLIPTDMFPTNRPV